MLALRSFAFLAASGLAIAAHAQTLYFTDFLNADLQDGAIRIINADGSELHTIHITGSGIRGLVIDAPSRVMYWSDVNALAIRRSALDGRNQADVVTSDLQFPSVLRQNPADGRLFWGDQLSDELRRAEADGSNSQLVRSTPFHRGIAIDSVNGKIYWSTSISQFRGDIVRSNFDGGNLETIITTLVLPEFKPSAIALDVAAGKIYWTDYVVDAVRRANLDGTNVEDLFFVGANENPGGIALDLAAGKVYWGQDNVVFGPGAQIMRMDLDGGNPELVAQGFGHVVDIAIVPGNTCYANCDSSTAQPILNANDFQCFLNNFAAGLPIANCDNSIAEPTLNANDFQCFLNAYAAGCP